MSNGIVAPNPGSPFTVKDDRMLELRATLRLPLTPPPGVQQTAAVQGWRVTLTTEDAWNTQGAPEKLRYELPVMRIRPFKGNTYRIFVELPPWLPHGRFDAALRGPGFSAESPESVIVPAEDNAQPESVVVIKGEPGKILSAVPNRESPKKRFRLVLGKNETGVKVTFQKKPIFPSSIAFAALPHDGTRVLSFVIDSSREVENSKPAASAIEWSTVKSSPCNGEITLSKIKANDATAYRNITLHTEKKPHTVIWDFGDGRFGAGNPVRHRWLLNNETTVKAWKFNRFGQSCKIEADTSLNALNRSGGCSCIAPGR